MGGMKTLPDGSQAKTNMFDLFSLAATMKRQGRKMTQDEFRQWFPGASEKQVARGRPMLGGGAVSTPEKTADSSKPAEPLTRPRNTAGGFFGMLGG